VLTLFIRRAIKRPKLEHLLQLLARKRALEAKIEDCHSQKDAAYVATAHKIQLAISKRVATLQ